MEQKNVAIEKKDGIGFLTLNRPPRNLISAEVTTEIVQGVKELDEDDDVGVIVVKGAGPNFSLGADLADEVRADKAKKGNFFLGIMNVYKAFPKLNKVVIAMVHGYALAAGAGIALSCDLVVASEDAYFGTTAVNVGLFCLSASAVILPRVMSGKKALEMGLTGDIISAREAERLGMVNKVVPTERLEQETVELAQKILAKNPIAIALGKRNFYTCADMEYDKALEHTAAMFSILSATKEAEEGIRAFLEKREPKWRK